MFNVDCEMFILTCPNQGMKSKEIYSSSRRRNLKGPEIQFYKTNCFLNHPFDSVVDKGNNSKKLSTGVDVVRL